MSFQKRGSAAIRAVRLCLTGLVASHLFARLSLAKSLDQDCDGKAEPFRKEGGKPQKIQ